MYERSYPKSIPCQTNMPKNIRKSKHTVTFIPLHGIGKIVSPMLILNIA